jgi:hypothetical protein
LSGICDNCSSRVTIGTDDIRFITYNFDNFVRTAPRINKFSNSTQLCIAGNLDTGCDEITDTKIDNRVRVVSSRLAAWPER